MQKLDFDEAVERIVAEDPRFTADAYYFLRDGLDLAVKVRKRQTGESGHVSGQQICEALRQLAVKHYGPMVPTVLAHWGITKTEDFGAMVWTLINLGVFGKTPSDSPDDFKAVYEFRDAFVLPYLPDTPSRRPGKRVEKVNQ